MSGVLLQFLLYTFMIPLSVAILLQVLVMSEKKVAVVNNREEVINEVLLFDMKVYLRKNPLIWILFMYKYFYSCLLHAHMFPCLLIRGQCLSL